MSLGLHLFLDFESLEELEEIQDILDSFSEMDYTDGVQESKE